MAYSQYYVYTLAYPDGRIFYVGKGQGDRILQHEKEARQYYHTQQQESAKVRVIREIWASGGQVVKTKVLETENEEEAYEYEKQYIAQCDPSSLTNRTKGGGPQFSKQDPYARLKHRAYFYSPKEAQEKLGISQKIWHRLFLGGVLHFYQAEGCTLPVLHRKEIDDFAARIKDGTYPLDAWEMAAPNVWKTEALEKKSLWWDDEPSPRYREEQYPMSKVEMQREAITIALNAAQQAFSEPCHLIGSYELRQREQSERAWNIVIQVDYEQYTYVVTLHQNQFILSKSPTKPSPHPQKQEESYELSEWDELLDKAFPAVDQAALEATTSDQLAAEPVTTRASHSLTLAQVKERWESILRRIRSKKDGAKVAALLRGYDIVGVNENEDVPIVMLKARSFFHYAAIQQGGYQQSIEQVFKRQLEQECRLHLLSPEESFP